MLPHTNPNGTLTAWGVQQRIGLLVEVPGGHVAELKGFVGLNKDIAEVMFDDYSDGHYLVCDLRPHPIPLTPKTAYVGQWIRLIDKPHLIGQIKEIEYRNGGHGAYIYFSPSVRNMYYLSRLEALPPHAQDTPNLNQDETTN